MPFASGRVSYTTYRVVGDGPDRADETVLALLGDFAFVESDIGRPDEVEAGFTTGEHLFDTGFSYEKNVFGPVGDESLLFALRVDTHKVPSEVRQAYRKMHEQAAAAESPTGVTSRAERRTAAEQAAAAMDEDLRAGRYRRSRQVPLLWRLRDGVLLCGNASHAVHDALTAHFRKAFELTLEQLSAGGWARDRLTAVGRTRDFEDLRPSGYTDPPADYQPGGDGDDASGPAPGFDPRAPLVPWVVKAVDYKDFLGNEWLMWLWWLCETAEGAVPIVPDLRGGPGKRQAGEREVWAGIDQSVDMHCAWDVRGRQSLRGHAPHRLPEAGEALRHGKWPRKLGLILSQDAGPEPAAMGEGSEKFVSGGYSGGYSGGGSGSWTLSVQGDRFTVSGAALPAVEDAASPRELIEARIESIWSLHAVVTGAYFAFLDRRTGSGWPGVREGIRHWIASRRPRT